ncbi:MAG: MATE family efflux transporter [Eubacterium sp.]|jgi:putative MATE family efflux protein|nr:MATE family efflux transporter [Eubacterium sp.]
MQTNEAKLGSAPLFRLMLGMGIPTLIAQIINLLYNIIDRMYIGHIPDVGATALTGVGLALPMIVIISAFSAFVGAGGAPLSAIALGRGDKEEAEKILGNGFSLLVLFSIVLMIVFFFIKKPMLYRIGASDATFPYADDYMTIYILGTFFVQITLGMNPYITAQGCSRTAMVSTLIGAILNIALDPLFIFGFGMGIQGAALATVISQFVSAVWVLRFLTRKERSMGIRKEKLKLQRRVITKLMALGISPFIMQATESMISIVMNSGLQKYGGDMYVGTLTIMQSVMQFISIPVNGFTQGVQPILSYNYGAGNRDRVKKTFTIMFAIVMTYTVLLTGTAMLFPAMFAKMFTNNTELVTLVSRVLPIFLGGMLVFGIQMSCQTTFLALGQAKVSLFIALLRKVILLIPLALLLPKITGDVMFIYYAEPISDVTSAVTCGILFIFLFRRILKS